MDSPLNNSLVDLIIEDSALLESTEPNVELSVLLEAVEPDEPQLPIAPSLTILKIITNNGGKPLFVFTDDTREYHYVNYEVRQMKGFAGYTGYCRCNYRKNSKHGACNAKMMLRFSDSELVTKTDRPKLSSNVKGRPNALHLF